MAQSRMGKGPDGTNGFAEGWTKRVSSYAVKEEEEKAEPEILQRERSSSLSVAAPAFVPNFAVPDSSEHSGEYPIAASGFDSSGRSGV